MSLGPDKIRDRNFLNGAISRIVSLVTKSTDSLSLDLYDLKETVQGMGSGVESQIASVAEKIEKKIPTGKELSQEISAIEKGIGLVKEAVDKKVIPVVDLAGLIEEVKSVEKAISKLPSDPPEKIVIPDFPAFPKIPDNKKDLQAILFQLTNLNESLTNLSRQTPAPVNFPEAISLKDLPALASGLESIKREISKSARTTSKNDPIDFSPLLIALSDIKAGLAGIKSEFPSEINIGNFPPQMVPQPVTKVAIRGAGVDTEVTGTTVGSKYALDVYGIPLAIKIVESGTTTYVGKAVPGTALSSATWQAFKMDESSGLVLTWADGDSNFDNVATDLTALTYS